MAKHGVIRTDRLYGTDVAANLISVKYMGAATTATDIDNGNVVAVGGLMTGEREVFVGTTPAKNTVLGKIALIATPEVMYDERKKNLADFYNEAGKICRAYKLHENDIFGVTAEALNIGDGVTPAVGYIVELQAGVKMNVVETLTSGATKVGEIIAIDKVGNLTYYVVEVK